MEHNAGIAVTAAVALVTSLGSPRVAAENAPSTVPSVPSQATSVSQPVATASGATAKVLFGFEDGLQGWGIPDWALEKSDMVAKDVLVTKAGATEGHQALGVTVDFPGGKWNGALVEIDRKSTRLNSSHSAKSRMPSSA